MKPKKENDLYEEVAKEFKVSPELVEKTVRDLFFQIRQDITKDTGEDILIHNFGNFTMKDSQIDIIEQNLEKGLQKGNISIKKYQATKEAITKIKKNRNSG